MSAIFEELILGIGFRADLIVEKKVLIEINSIESLANIASVQPLTYLRFSGISIGLLINFNVEKLKDGIFLMVTGDGRSESSGGMSWQQLAEFVLEQGATDAMNLDGGGSTTMFLDGKVVNHPSDKEGERSVGDAILVFPRKKQ